MSSDDFPPSIITTDQTEEEQVCPLPSLPIPTADLIQANIHLCKTYMSIAYSPTRASSTSVSHLCHPTSTFSSPSTFPHCSTPLDYASSHARVMKSVPDLHILRFDRVFAKNGHVLLRYTASGTFSGSPYEGIEANGRKAQWGASAIFEVEGGKIKTFVKDWDQKVMQIQLGWAPVMESENPRWNREALAKPEEMGG